MDRQEFWNKVIDAVARQPVHKRAALGHQWVVARQVERIEAGHAIEMLDAMADRAIANKLKKGNG